MSVGVAGSLDSQRAPGTPSATISVMAIRKQKTEGKKTKSGKAIRPVRRGKKRCYWCKKDKSVKDYCVSTANDDGLNNWCRECNWEVHASHRSRQLARSGELEGYIMKLARRMEIARRVQAGEDPRPG